MFVGLRPGNRKKLKAESPRGPSAGPGYEPGLAASCTEGISKLEPPQWPKLSYEPDIERRRSFRKPAWWRSASAVPRVEEAELPTLSPDGGGRRKASPGLGVLCRPFFLFPLSKCGAATNTPLHHLSKVCVRWWRSERGIGDSIVPGAMSLPSLASNCLNSLPGIGPRAG